MYAIVGEQVRVRLGSAQIVDERRPVGRVDHGELTRLEVRRVAIVDHRHGLVARRHHVEQRQGAEVARRSLRVDVFYLDRPRFAQ